MSSKRDVAARLIDLMQDEVTGTETELATRVRANVKSVRAILSMWLKAGIVHVAEEGTPGHACVFRYGGKAPPPVASPAVKAARLRRLSEMDLNRWPQLDPDLAAAVDAMVRVRPPVSGRDH